jgi:hypothetical protein
MTKYVAQENQELLWKMLNSTKTFSRQPENIKISLFKGTIERMYNQRVLKTLNYQQLQEMNKNTLTSILGTLSKPNPHIVEHTLTSDVKVVDHTGTVVPTPPGTHGYVIESSEEKATREFHERQQMYENMNAKPKLPDAQNIFGEKDIDDGVIRNMDELLQQYQSQRSTDISLVQQNMPPPVPQSSNSSSTTTFTSNQESLEKRIIAIETRLTALEKISMTNHENTQHKP